MTAQLPFAAIADAALARAEQLLAEWLPGGQKVGVEWKALNPTRADGKIGSFSVNLVTGYWGDFACDDKGGDLVSLYAYLFHHGDQGKAAVELAERFGIALPPLGKGRKRKAKASASPPPPAAPAEPPKPKEPRTYWQPIFPAPEDAGEPPKAHPNRGMPTRIFTYRAPDGVNGYVCRFVTSDGGKDDIPLIFAQHAKSGKREWRWMAFGEDSRPLYGLDQEAAKPEASILFVEGEKCAEAAEQALSDLVVMTWQGGCNAAGKADFTTLAERPVKKALLWPDCDAKREKLSKAEKEAGVDPASKSLLPVEKQPGTKAMLAVAERLHALGYLVWMIDIPKPGEKPDGWDIADAIAEGYTGATLADYLKTHAKKWTASAHRKNFPADPAEVISTPSEAGAGKGRKSWIPDLIWGRDGLKNCLSNVYQVLAHSSAWRGVVGFDEFSLCVVKRKPPPYEHGTTGEWDSTDDSRTALWLARLDPDWAFTPSSDMVAEAIEVLARANAFHPVREYLAGLKWDGEKRLNGWLTKYLGVPLTPYSARVARWWLMGAVRRVLTPGFKFDYCLVLEGAQGKGKSTALSIIGGAYFGDTDLDLTHKDSMSALRGKWVYEISEMGALVRSEEKRQKSFLSRTIDEYRPVYGRREIKAPRQVVFGGSTNEFEWNKDPTGGRRFWPVECIGVFDLDGLRAVRDQLFAEALAAVNAGESCYPVSDEQREIFDPEQLKVEQQDSLLDAVHDWVYGRVSDFSMFDVTHDCLKLDASKVTRDLQTRLGTALRKLGCARVERRNGMIRYWYKPPARNGASSTSDAPAQPDWEDDHVPL